MICVYLVLILLTCHTRAVLQCIIHVCNFFFNHNVYKMILQVFFLMGMWPFGYNENKLVKIVKIVNLYIYTFKSQYLSKRARLCWSSSGGSPNKNITVYCTHIIKKMYIGQRSDLSLKLTIEDICNIISALSSTCITPVYCVCKWPK